MQQWAREKIRKNHPKTTIKSVAKEQTRDEMERKVFSGLWKEAFHCHDHSMDERRETCCPKAASSTVFFPFPETNTSERIRIAQKEFFFSFSCFFLACSWLKRILSDHTGRVVR
jgi:hypothetical protein